MFDERGILDHLRELSESLKDWKRYCLNHWRVRFLDRIGGFSGGEARDRATKGEFMRLYVSERV